MSADPFMLSNVVPWHPSQWQVSKYGTRYYADLQPPCELIADPHAEPMPGFTSLKPSKPFRKSVTVGDRKYTVPLDWYRAGEWFADNVLDLKCEQDAHRFYQSAHTQRDRDFARGHAIHAAAEAFLVDQPYVCTNTDALPYIEPLREWIAANVTGVAAIEAVVFGEGYGGSGDCWLTVRGTPVYVDWKSRGGDSSHGIYEEEVMQGGAYNAARYCILPHGLTFKRAPIPPAEYGMVLSIKPDGVEEFWYDLDEAKRSFRCLFAGYHSGKEGAKIARAAKVPAPAAKGGETSTFLAPSPRIANLLARLKTIAAMSPEMAQSVRASWPAGVPKLSDGGHTEDDFDRIEWLVADAEDRISAPFADLPVKPAPLRTVNVAEVRARVVPDEGEPAGEGRMVQMRELHGALDDAQRAWIAALADQSRAVASFHLSERKTTRSTRIVRGLIVLAANDCMDDDLVRAAAAFALDSDEPLHPSLPTGAAIAALGWIEAGTFLAACETFVAGGMAIDIDDTGVMRLIDKPLTEAEAAARLGALPA